LGAVNLSLPPMVYSGDEMQDQYDEDNLLMLSGIQHMAFCERQWAFIHIEQQWSENRLTIEGSHLHERVDDPFERDNRKGIISLRSVSLMSRALGLTGVADAIELIPADIQTGIALPDKEGFWLFHPVEYKRGKPKPDDRDEVQLCAQAMCLEEMYSVFIKEGAIFYGETRHRLDVNFSNELRQRVFELVQSMHLLFSKGLTPLPVFKPHCKSCSLFDICLPQMANNQKVTDYLKWELDMD